MINTDAIFHVKGESQFVDDRLNPEGTLHAAVYSSPVAHAKISKVDIAPAMGIKGVAEVLTAADIPGENQIGLIIQDEVLFAEDEVQFIGQPIAVVISSKLDTSRKAVKAIKAEFKSLPPVFDPRDAFKKGQLITPTRTFSLGDVDKKWSECDLIVEGVAESKGQEHAYLETQGAFSYTTEKNTLKVISSTQSPTSVQRIVARVLNIPMHKVEVDVLRIGGGFGGKEDQAVSWAVMTALASYKLKKPVKLILRRNDDIRMTGKPLGRPKKETEKNKEELKVEKKQRYQDDIDRIAVEGRFGVGKRKYGLGLIKAKLKETSETEIFLSILVMNLDKMCSEELKEIKDRYKIKREKVA